MREVVSHEGCTQQCPGLAAELQVERCRMSSSGFCLAVWGAVLTLCPLLLQDCDRRAWELPPLVLWDASANPMHPDNKLPSHGKAGSSGAPAQHHNVSQAPTCNLGSKGVGAGSHGGKATQISPGNSGLKNSQNTVPNFSSLKGKVKRERSISVDSGEQREAGTPSLDTESKGNVLLSCGSEVLLSVAPSILAGAGMGAAVSGLCFYAALLFGPTPAACASPLVSSAVLGAERLSVVVP